MYMYINVVMAAPPQVVSEFMTCPLWDLDHSPPDALHPLPHQQTTATPPPCLYHYPSLALTCSLSVSPSPPLSHLPLPPPPPLPLLPPPTISLYISSSPLTSHFFLIHCTPSFLPLIFPPAPTPLLYNTLPGTPWAK